MGRLMSIDYGRKRCGIAVTDPMRIVANGLTTVATHLLVDFIIKYTATESVDAIVVGLPTTMRGELSESMQYIRAGITHLQRKLPGMPVVYWDERFTSVLAHRSMLDSGMKKSSRRDKGTVDEISATIILNDYLQSRQFGASGDNI